jgi:hypothetical protein
MSKAIIMLILLMIVLSLSSMAIGDNEAIDIDSVYYGALWDCNHDGITNYLDVSFVSNMYGSSGSPNDTWSRADIDNDGDVDSSDVTLLSTNYLETWLEEAP